MPRYRAIIETDMSSIYQTNLIYVYILEDEIILHKEGIFAVNYYAIRFNPSNLIVLKYKRVSNLKTKLTIYHTENGMHSPYNVMITSCMKDNAFEKLDRLCERVREGVL